VVSDPDTQAATLCRLFWIKTGFSRFSFFSFGTLTERAPRRGGAAEAPLALPTRSAAKVPQAHRLLEYCDSSGTDGAPRVRSSEFRENQPELTLGQKNSL